MAIRNISPPRQFSGSEMQPGTRLRNARERLGLTYRAVERASYELACHQGRPHLIVHLSRLAGRVTRATCTGMLVWTTGGWNHCSALEVWLWSTPISRKFETLAGTTNMNDRFTSSRFARDSAAAGAAARRGN